MVIGEQLAVPDDDLCDLTEVRCGGCGQSVEFRGEFGPNAGAGGRAVTPRIPVRPAPQPARVEWVLNRIDTTYQWYAMGGDWNWEPITRRERIANGALDLAGAPGSISAPVDWGSYELVVTGPDGRAHPSPTPGTYGGHRGGRVYGRLDCRSALRALADGGYVADRVFFADEAGYIYLLALEDEAISLNSRNLMAMDASLSWDINRVKGAGTRLAKARERIIGDLPEVQFHAVAPLERRQRSEQ
mgnify:CR=1 FL=1